MAALQEVEHLLDKATLGQGAEVVNGAVVSVATLGVGVDLVYGVFGYQKRAIGVEGRLLIPDLTTQPVLAVREERRITPLPYAEDVVAHPLSQRLLEALSIG